MDATPSVPENAAAAFAASLAASQVEVAKKGQDAFFTTVDSVINSVPALPSVDLPEQVTDAVKPAVDFFGSTDELKGYAIETSHAWAELTREFTDKLVAELHVKA